jgi:SAM-dependent methyltransferase
MLDAGELADRYIENPGGAAFGDFLDRYLSAVENTPCENFCRIARWYSEKFVLPSLSGEPCSDPVVGAQKETEEEFVRGELLPGCAILDAGCGPGRVPALFHSDPRVRSIHAFDFSSEMLEIARELVSGFGAEGKVKLFLADMRAIPDLGLAAPVIVTCLFGTYGNIPAEKDRVEALRRMHANAHGGKVLLSVFNAEKVGDAREYYAGIGHGAGADLRELRDVEGGRVFFVSPGTGSFSVWFEERGLRAEIRKAGLEARIRRDGEMLLAVIE